MRVMLGALVARSEANAVQPNALQSGQVAQSSYIACGTLIKLVCACLFWQVGAISGSKQIGCHLNLDSYFDWCISLCSSSCKLETVVLVSALQEGVLGCRICTL